MSFLDPITAAGPATELVTTGSPVNVGSSPPPNPGDVLKAVDATHATWQPGGGGGSGGDASGLETTGAPVDVAGSAPPVQGQVLMAVDAEHAEWRVPGLHYDPSIKFWTSSIGSATIAPGTWGFVEQAVGAVDPIVVYIVSSLEAPPVDSRFALYVGRDVTVPVTVSVLGASQIQGLDGVLGTSTTLLPGSDYEWVFYHEDGAALWGLVSDTAAVAKRIAVVGGVVEVKDSSPPIVGDVLTAIDATHAEWRPGRLRYVDLTVDMLEANTWGITIATDDEGFYLSGLPMGLPDGTRVGFMVGPDSSHGGFQLPEPMQDRDGTIGAGCVLEQGQYGEWTFVADDGVWYMTGITLGFTPDSILPGDVYSEANGAAYRGGETVPARADHSHVVKTSAPAALTVGGSMVTGVATWLSRSDHQHAMPGLATGAAHGFMSLSDFTKLAGIAAGAAALTSTAPSQITVTTAAAGSATDAARRDHVHSVSVGTPTSLAVGGSNVGGSSNQLARGDHIHALPAFGSASGTFAQGNDTRFLKASTLSGSNDVSISGAPSAINGQVLQAYAATTAAWLFQSMGGLNQLRLSVSPTDAVPTSDVAAASTLYLLPYTGNLISLISTSLNQAVPYPLSSSSLALTGLTTDTVYDVFGYLTNQANPLAGAIGLELLAWASATVRAVGLTRGPSYGNMWVKSGDNSRRYLGTIRARSATTISWRTAGNDANPPRCDLWNVDNQVKVPFAFLYSNATYAVSGASAWQILGNAKLEYVQGIQSTYAAARAIVSTGNAAAGNEGDVAFMQDAALTTPVGLRGKFKSNATNEVAVAKAEHQWQTPIGSRTLSLGLLSNVTSQTFYGTDSGGMQSGFYVDLAC